MKMPNDLAASIESVVRQWFLQRLAQCTPEQRALFGRMYPDGLTMKQIPNAADQVLRTIKKNQRGKVVTSVS